MKKAYRVIEILESIREQREITDLCEAAWLSRFKYEHPLCIHIIYNQKHSGWYFRAILTSAGRHYIEELNHNEIFRVPQEIHIL